MKIMEKTEMDKLVVEAVKRFVKKEVEQEKFLRENDGVLKEAFRLHSEIDQTAKGMGFELNKYQLDGIFVEFTNMMGEK